MIGIYKKELPSSLFSSAINPFTGKLSFSLPILSFFMKKQTQFSFGLKYNSSIKLQEKLWHMPQYKIVSNDNDEYKLIIEENSYNLIKFFSNIDNNIIGYKINDSSSNIIFNKNKCSWIITADLTTWLYESINPNKNEWNLKKVKFKQNEEISFNYDKYNRLISIESNNEEISFTYNGENRLPNQIKNLNNSYDLALNYDENNNLLEIKQNNSISIQFEYNQNQNQICQIKKIIVPDVFKLEYNYDNLPSKITDDSKSYLINREGIKIFYADSYILCLSKDNFNRIGIELLDKETLRPQKSSFSNYDSFPLFNIENYIENYYAIISTNFFAIVIEYKLKQKVYIFSQNQQNTWCNQPEVFDLSQGQIKLGEDCLIHCSKLGKFSILYKNSIWKLKELEVQINASNYIPFSILGKELAVCDGINLYVYSIIANNTVREVNKTSCGSNCLSSIYEHVSKYIKDIDENNKDILLKNLLENFLIFKEDKIIIPQIQFIYDPNASSIAYKSGVVIFQRSANSTFDLLKAIDAKDQKNLQFLSRNLFPNDFFLDDTNKRYNCHLDIYLKKMEKVYYLRYRFLDYFPATCFDPGKSFDDFDWKQGIEYKYQQDSNIFLNLLPAKIKIIKKNLDRPKDDMQRTYIKEQETYKIIQKNLSFKNDLEKGLFTYQQTLEQENVLVNLTPELEKKKLNILFLSGENKGKSVDQDLTDNQIEDYNYFYQMESTFSEEEFRSSFERFDNVPFELLKKLFCMFKDFYPCYDEDAQDIKFGDWIVKSENQYTNPEKYSEPTSWDIDKEKGIKLVKNNQNNLFEIKHENKTISIGNIYLECYSTKGVAGITWQSGNNIEFFCFEDYKSYLVAYGAKLLPFLSSRYCLATIGINFSENDLVSVRLYSITINISDKKNEIISSQKICYLAPTSTSNSQDISYFTTYYEYEEPVMDGSNIFYKSVSIIPESKEEMPFGKTSLKSTVEGIEENIYNKNKELIQTSANRTKLVHSSDKTFPFSESSSGNGTKEQMPSTVTSCLYDKQGLLLAIVEGAFFETQEADFICFDGTQIDRTLQDETTSTSNFWKIEGGEIQEKEIGFTGLGYLKLNPGGKVQSTYSPVDTENSYRLSAWIKVDKNHQEYLKESNKIIQLILYNVVDVTTKVEKFKTLSFILKNTEEDQNNIGWYYIESQLELWRFKQNYELFLISELLDQEHPESGKIYLEKNDNNIKYIVRDLQGNKKTGDINIELNNEVLNKDVLNSIEENVLQIIAEKGHILTNKFEIQTIIQAPELTEIYLDHIQFSPVSSDFEAYRYDLNYNNPNVIIKRDGTFVKTVRDNFDNIIANANELNEVFEIKSQWNSSEFSVHKEALGDIYFPTTVSLDLEWGELESWSQESLIKKNINLDYNIWKNDSHKLTHESSNEDVIIYNSNMLSDCGSIGCSFQISNLAMDSTLVLELGQYDVIFCLSETENAGGNKLEIQTNDLIQLVMIEKERIFIWINGQIVRDLLIEKQDSNIIKIKAKNQVSIEKWISFFNPSISITYGDPVYGFIQELQLKNCKEVVLKQTTYDALLRKSIVTLPCTVKSDQRLLCYYENILNKDPINNDTQELQIKISAEHKKEFSYTKLNYGENPLAIVESIRNPGKAFISHPKVFWELSLKKNMPDNAPIKLKNFFEIIRNDYPIEEGFILTFIQDGKGYLSVKVKNQNNQIVAIIADRPFRWIDIKDPKVLRLTKTTSSYDKYGNLIELVSPKFYSQNIAKIINLNKVKKVGKFINYYEDGKPCKLIDPDTGMLLNIYDETTSLCSYQLYFDFAELPETYTFSHALSFIYDMQGRNQQTRYYSIEDMSPLLTNLDLNTCLNTGDIDIIIKLLKKCNHRYGGSLLLQSIVSEEVNPQKRGKLKTSLTIQMFEKKHFEFGIHSSVSANADEESNQSDFDIRDIHETFEYDKNSIQKTLCIWDNEEEKITYFFDKKGRISKINYPSISEEIITVYYNYNLQGQLVQIQYSSCLKEQSTDVSKVILAQFDYTASGNVEKEIYNTNNLTRIYKYNDSGLLCELDDIYLKEEISFTENGYPDLQGYFDGSVAATKFTAKWLDTLEKDCSLRQQLKEKLKITNKPLRNMSLSRADYYLEEDIEEYLNICEKKKYITQQGYINNLENLISNKISSSLDLPDIVVRSVSDKIIQASFSKCYGNQYGYTNDGQLIHAKYSIGNEAASVRTLGLNALNTLELNESIGSNLLNKLADRNFITQEGMIIGSICNDDIIDQDLSMPETINYKGNLKKLLKEYYCKDEIFELEKFQEYCIAWRHPMSVPSRSVALETANKIFNILKDKCYLTIQQPEALNQFKVNNKILSTKLLGILESFNLSEEKTKSLINMLSQSEQNQIGESILDLETFDIDLNGNLNKYCCGGAHRELKYNASNNRLEKLIHTQSGSNDEYGFEYDKRGNITRAPHKRIEHIVYDYVLNRPILVQTTGGVTIKYGYDRNGSRTIKQICNNEKVTNCIIYIRNEKGQILIERRFEEEHLVMEIAYIYGPGGLIGFFQKNLLVPGEENKFFNVIKDHESSIRLIISPEKKVVCAFDYLPYGGLARSFGITDLIPFRFASQEWDEDLDLYNFQARIYDPDLGRFYQPDPKAQYASPYIYAGNSPITMIDPSGEFSLNAFLGGILSATEIAGGIALDIFTVGVGEALGGALIGAGTSGLIYSIQSGDDFKLRDFGVEEGIGAFTGLLTGGVGVFGGKVAAKVGETFLKEGLLRSLTQIGIRTVFQSAGSSLGNVTNQFIENVADHNSLSTNLVKSALSGALMGASSGFLGEGFSKAGSSLIKGNSRTVGNILQRSILGMIGGISGDTLGILISNAVEGGRPLDEGLWQAAIGGIIGGASTAGHIMHPEKRYLCARGIKEIEITSISNCARKAPIEYFLREKMPIEFFKSINHKAISEILQKECKTPEEIQEAFYNPPKDIQLSKKITENLHEEMLNTWRNKVAEKMNEMCSNPEEKQNFEEKFCDLLTDSVKTNTFEHLPSSIVDDLKNIRIKYLVDQNLDDLKKEILDHIQSNDKTIKGDYIGAIKEGSVWGNFFELDIASSLFKIQFKIKHTDPFIGSSKWLTIGEKSGTKIYLNNENNHYNLYIKQGISFLEKVRQYEVIETYTGWGAGKEAIKIKDSIMKNNPNISRLDLEKEIVKQCINKGGAHGQTKKFSSIKLVESDHFPPACTYKESGNPQLVNIPRDKMGAVTIPYEVHRTFITTGSSCSEKKFRTKISKFLNAGQGKNAIIYSIEAYKNAGILPKIKKSIKEALEVHVKNKLITDQEKQDIIVLYQLNLVTLSIAMEIFLTKNNLYYTICYPKKGANAGFVCAFKEECSIYLLMAQNDIVKALGSNVNSIESRNIEEIVVPKTDYFPEYDFKVQYNENNEAIFIEAGSKANVYLYSMLVFDTSFNSVVSALKKEDTNYEETEKLEEKDRLVIFKKLGLSIWTNYDFNQPAYSLSLFKPNYYSELNNPMFLLTGVNMITNEEDILKEINMKLNKISETLKKIADEKQISEEDKEYLKNCYEDVSRKLDELPDPAACSELQEEKDKLNEQIENLNMKLNDKQDFINFLNSKNQELERKLLDLLIGDLTGFLKELINLDMQNATPDDTLIDNISKKMLSENIPLKGILKAINDSFDPILPDTFEDIVWPKIKEKFNENQQSEIQTKVDEIKQKWPYQSDIILNQSYIDAIKNTNTKVIDIKGYKVTLDENITFLNDTSPPWKFNITCHTFILDNKSLIMECSGKSGNLIIDPIDANVGEDGGQGQKGNPGFPASEFQLMTYKIRYEGRGNLTLILNGGNGGLGQKGANGGVGVRGNDGTDDILEKDCTGTVTGITEGRQATPGQQGGSGGPGGEGGQGGDTSLCSIVTTMKLPSILTFTRNIGQGGIGGQGGNPGVGGLGGREGIRYTARTEVLDINVHKTYFIKDNTRIQKDHGPSGRNKGADGQVGSYGNQFHDKDIYVMPRVNFYTKVTGEFVKLHNNLIFMGAANFTSNTEAIPSRNNNLHNIPVPENKKNKYKCNIM